MKIRERITAFTMAILCSSVLLLGCQDRNKKNNSSISLFSECSMTETTMQYTENIWQTSNIDIDEAAANLSKIIQNDNLHLSCERVDFYNERCCYIFRCFEDYDDRRVTIAWYAVDAETGECFDTNVLTKLEPI